MPVEHRRGVIRGSGVLWGLMHHERNHVDITDQADPYLRLRRLRTESDRSVDAPDAAQRLGISDSDGEANVPPRAAFISARRQRQACLLDQSWDLQDLPHRR